MSIDTKITVSGWVGTQPRHVVTQNGTSFTVFRLGSTKRYFDRSQEAWVDGATTWYTVKSWRTAAVNVAESLRRSDPVVVHGTFATETWESPDGPRTTLVVEADALGPDLTRGQATFRHTVHLPAADASSSRGVGAAPGPGAGPGTSTGSAGLGAPGLTVVDDPWATGAPVEPGAPDGDRDAEQQTGPGDDTGADGESPVPAPPETDQPMSA
ncbi:single stranded DNA-binding protein [Sanguibacter keddieii DSM 10542]|uniref:Single stranded DNA-binding protein n=1 Tax=Sanguibacter keddieii (strain ATCC 51767 / DSM 10542 / NCFB 3025 / ST-74) TaxID=446469 RepID=D1BJX5_SANKS|nr:single-stranded DNA-binding protein [Sanguibacter keddieii]ACZ22384.1 single stranded DNA-binding protein [Sanguibacter keddieii DSM 10542]